MSDGGSAAGAGELVYDESYGPIARSATPTEHVYFSVVTIGRWVIAMGCVGFSVIVSWMFQTDAAKDELGRYLFMPLFVLMAVALLVVAFVALYARAAITITPAGITLRRRGLGFGRRTHGSWKLEDLVSVDIGEMATFHVGGSTPLYYLVLRFSTGEAERLGGTFDTIPSTQRVADAIWQSVIRMSGIG